MLGKLFPLFGAGLTPTDASAILKSKHTIKQWASTGTGGIFSGSGTDTITSGKAPCDQDVFRFFWTSENATSGATLAQKRANIYNLVTKGPQGSQVSTQHTARGITKNDVTGLTKTDTEGVGKDKKWVDAGQYQKGHYTQGVLDIVWKCVYTPSAAGSVETTVHAIQQLDAGSSDLSQPAQGGTGTGASNPIQWSVSESPDTGCAVAPTAPVSPELYGQVVLSAPSLASSDAYSVCQKATGSVETLLTMKFQKYFVCTTNWENCKKTEYDACVKACTDSGKTGAALTTCKAACTQREDECCSSASSELTFNKVFQRSCTTQPASFSSSKSHYPLRSYGWTVEGANKRKCRVYESGKSVKLTFPYTTTLSSPSTTGTNVATLERQTWNGGAVPVLSKATYETNETYANQAVTTDKNNALVTVDTTKLAAGHYKVTVHDRSVISKDTSFVSCPAEADRPHASFTIPTKLVNRTDAYSPWKDTTISPSDFFVFKVASNRASVENLVGAVADSYTISFQCKGDVAVKTLFSSQSKLSSFKDIGSTGSAVFDKAHEVNNMFTFESGGERVFIINAHTALSGVASKTDCGASAKIGENVLDLLQHTELSGLKFNVSGTKQTFSKTINVLWNQFDQAVNAKHKAFGSVTDQTKPVFSMVMNKKVKHGKGASLCGTTAVDGTWWYEDLSETETGKTVGKVKVADASTASGRVEVSLVKDDGSTQATIKKGIPVVIKMGTFCDSDNVLVNTTLPLQKATVAVSLSADANKHTYPVTASKAISTRASIRFTIDGHADPQAHLKVASTNHTFTLPLDNAYAQKQGKADNSASMWIVNTQAQLKACTEYTVTLPAGSFKYLMTDSEVTKFTTLCYEKTEVEKPTHLAEFGSQSSAAAPLASNIRVTLAFDQVIETAKFEGTNPAAPITDSLIHVCTGKAGDKCNSASTSWLGSFRLDQTTHQCAANTASAGLCWSRSSAAHDSTGKGKKVGDASKTMISIAAFGQKADGDAKSGFASDRSHTGIVISSEANAVCAARKASNGRVCADPFTHHVFVAHQKSSNANGVQYDIGALKISDYDNVWSTWINQDMTVDSYNEYLSGMARFNFLLAEFGADLTTNAGPHSSANIVFARKGNDAAKITSPQAVSNPNVPIKALDITTAKFQNIAIESPAYIFSAEFDRELGSMDMSALSTKMCWSARDAPALNTAGTAETALTASTALAYRRGKDNTDTCQAVGRTLLCSVQVKAAATADGSKVGTNSVFKGPYGLRSCECAADDKSPCNSAATIQSAYSTDKAFVNTGAFTKNLLTMAGKTTVQQVLTTGDLANQQVFVLAHDNAMSQRKAGEDHEWEAVPGTCAGGPQNIKFYFNVDVKAQTEANVKVNDGGDISVAGVCSAILQGWSNQVACTAKAAHQNECEAIGCAWNAAGASDALKCVTNEAKKCVDIKSEHACGDGTNGNCAWDNGSCKSSKPCWTITTGTAKTATKAAALGNVDVFIPAKIMNAAAAKVATQLTVTFGAGAVKGLADGSGAANLAAVVKFNLCKARQLSASPKLLTLQFPGTAATLKSSAGFRSAHQFTFNFVAGALKDKRGNTVDSSSKTWHTKNPVAPTFDVAWFATNMKKTLSKTATLVFKFSEEVGSVCTSPTAGCVDTGAGYAGGHLIKTAKAATDLPAAFLSNFEGATTAATTQTVQADNLIIIGKYMLLALSKADETGMQTELPTKPATAAKVAIDKAKGLWPPVANLAAAVVKSATGFYLPQDLHVALDGSFDVSSAAVAFSPVPVFIWPENSGSHEAIESTASTTFAVGKQPLSFPGLTTAKKGTHVALMLNQEAWVNTNKHATSKMSTCKSITPKDGADTTVCQVAKASWTGDAGASNGKQVTWTLWTNGAYSLKVGTDEYFGAAADPSGDTKAKTVCVAYQEDATPKCEAAGCKLKCEADPLCTYSDAGQGSCVAKQTARDITNGGDTTKCAAADTETKCTNVNHDSSSATGCVWSDGACAAKIAVNQGITGDGQCTAVHRAADKNGVARSTLANNMADAVSADCLDVRGLVRFEINTEWQTTNTVCNVHNGAAAEKKAACPKQPGCKIDADNCVADTAQKLDLPKGADITVQFAAYAFSNNADAAVATSFWPTSAYTHTFATKAAAAAAATVSQATTADSNSISIHDVKWKATTDNTNFALSKTGTDMWTATSKWVADKAGYAFTYTWTVYSSAPFDDYTATDAAGKTTTSAGALLSNTYPAATAFNTAAGLSADDQHYATGFIKTTCAGGSADCKNTQLDATEGLVQFTPKCLAMPTGVCQKVSDADCQKLSTDNCGTDCVKNTALNKCMPTAASLQAQCAGSCTAANGAVLGAAADASKQNRDGPRGGGYKMVTATAAALETATVGLHSLNCLSAQGTAAGKNLKCSVSQEVTFEPTKARKKTADECSLTGTKSKIKVDEATHFIDDDGTACAEHTGCKWEGGKCVVKDDADMSMAATVVKNVPIKPLTECFTAHAEICKAFSVADCTVGDKGVASGCKVNGGGTACEPKLTACPAMANVALPTGSSTTFAFSKNSFASTGGAKFGTGAFQMKVDVTDATTAAPNILPYLSRFLVPAGGIMSDDQCKTTTTEAACTVSSCKWIGGACRATVQLCFDQQVTTTGSFVNGAGNDAMLKVKDDAEILPITLHSAGSASTCLYAVGAFAKNKVYDIGIIKNAILAKNDKGIDMAKFDIGLDMAQAGALNEDPAAGTFAFSVAVVDDAMTTWKAGTTGAALKSSNKKPSFGGVKAHPAFGTIALDSAFAFQFDDVITIKAIKSTVTLYETSSWKNDKLVTGAKAVHTWGTAKDIHIGVGGIIYLANVPLNSGVSYCLHFAAGLFQDEFGQDSAEYNSCLAATLKKYTGSCQHTAGGTAQLLAISVVDNAVLTRHRPIACAAKSAANHLCMQAGEKVQLLWDRPLDTKFLDAAGTVVAEPFKPFAAVSQTTKPKVTNSGYAIELVVAASGEIGVPANTVRTKAGLTIGFKITDAKGTTEHDDNTCNKAANNGVGNVNTCDAIAGCKSTANVCSPYFVAAAGKLLPAFVNAAFTSSEDKTGNAEAIQIIVQDKTKWNQAAATSVEALCTGTACKSELISSPYNGQQKLNCQWNTGTAASITACNAIYDLSANTKTAPVCNSQPGCVFNDALVGNLKCTAGYAWRETAGGLCKQKTLGFVTPQSHFAAYQQVTDDAVTGQTGINAAKQFVGKAGASAVVSAVNNLQPISSAMFTATFFLKKTGGTAVAVKALGTATADVAFKDAAGEAQTKKLPLYAVANKLMVLNVPCSVGGDFAVTVTIAKSGLLHLVDADANTDDALQPVTLASNLVGSFTCVKDVADTTAPTLLSAKSGSQTLYTKASGKTNNVIAQGSAVLTFSEAITTVTTAISNGETECDAAVTYWNTGKTKALVEYGYNAGALKCVSATGGTSALTISANGLKDASSNALVATEIPLTVRPQRQAATVALGSVTSDMKGKLGGDSYGRHVSFMDQIWFLDGASATACSSSHKTPAYGAVTTLDTCGWDAAKKCVPSNANRGCSTVQTTHSLQQFFNNYPAAKDAKIHTLVDITKIVDVDGDALDVASTVPKGVLEAAQAFNNFNMQTIAAIAPTWTQDVAGNTLVKTKTTFTNASTANGQHFVVYSFGKDQITTIVDGHMWTSSGKVDTQKGTKTAVASEWVKASGVIPGEFKQTALANCGNAVYAIAKLASAPSGCPKESVGGVHQLVKQTTAGGAWTTVCRHHMFHRPLTSGTVAAQGAASHGGKFAEFNGAESLACYNGGNLAVTGGALKSNMAISQNADQFMWSDISEHHGKSTGVPAAKNRFFAQLASGHCYLGGSPSDATFDSYLSHSADCSTFYRLTARQTGADKTYEFAHHAAYAALADGAIAVLPGSKKKTATTVEVAGDVRVFRPAAHPAKTIVSHTDATPAAEIVDVVDFRVSFDRPNVKYNAATTGCGLADIMKVKGVKSTATHRTDGHAHVFSNAAKAAAGDAIELDMKVQCFSDAHGNFLAAAVDYDTAISADIVKVPVLSTLGFATTEENSAKNAYAAGYVVPDSNVLLTFTGSFGGGHRSFRPHAKGCALTFYNKAHTAATSNFPKVQVNMEPCGDNCDKYWGVAGKWQAFVNPNTATSVDVVLYNAAKNFPAGYKYDAVKYSKDCWCNALNACNPGTSVTTNGVTTVQDTVHDILKDEVDSRDMDKADGKTNIKISGATVAESPGTLIAPDLFGKPENCTSATSTGAAPTLDAQSNSRLDRPVVASGTTNVHFKFKEAVSFAQGDASVGNKTVVYSLKYGNGTVITSVAHQNFSTIANVETCGNILSVKNIPVPLNGLTYKVCLSPKVIAATTVKQGAKAVSRMAGADVCAEVKTSRNVASYSKPKLFAYDNHAQTVKAANADGLSVSMIFSQPINDKYCNTAAKPAFKVSGTTNKNLTLTNSSADRNLGVLSGELTGAIDKDVSIELETGCVFSVSGAANDANARKDTAGNDVVPAKWTATVLLQKAAADVAVITSVTAPMCNAAASDGTGPLDGVDTSLETCNSFKTEGDCNTKGCTWNKALAGKECTTVIAASDKVWRVNECAPDRHFFVEVCFGTTYAVSAAAGNAAIKTTSSTLADAQDPKTELAAASAPPAKIYGKNAAAFGQKKNCALITAELQAGDTYNLDLSTVKFTADDGDVHAAKPSGTSKDKTFIQMTAHSLFIKETTTLPALAAPVAGAAMYRSPNSNKLLVLGGSTKNSDDKLVHADSGNLFSSTFSRAVVSNMPHGTYSMPMKNGEPTCDICSSDQANDYSYPDIHRTATRYVVDSGSFMGFCKDPQGGHAANGPCAHTDDEQKLHAKCPYQWTHPPDFHTMTNTQHDTVPFAVQNAAKSYGVHWINGTGIRVAITIPGHTKPGHQILMKNKTSGSVHEFDGGFKMYVSPETRHHCMVSHYRDVDAVAVPMPCAQQSVELTNANPWGVGCNANRRRLQEKAAVVEAAKNVTVEEAAKNVTVKEDAKKVEEAAVVEEAAAAELAAVGTTAQNAHCTALAYAQRQPTTDPSTCSTDHNGSNNATHCCKTVSVTVGNATKTSETCSAAPDQPKDAILANGWVTPRQPAKHSSTCSAHDNTCTTHCSAGFTAKQVTGNAVVENEKYNNDGESQDAELIRQCNFGTYTFKTGSGSEFAKDGDATFACQKNDCADYLQAENGHSEAKDSKNLFLGDSVDFHCQDGYTFASYSGLQKGTAKCSAANADQPGDARVEFFYDEAHSEQGTKPAWTSDNKNQKCLPKECGITGKNTFDRCYKALLGAAQEITTWYPDESVDKLSSECSAVAAHSSLAILPLAMGGSQNYYNHQLVGTGSLQGKTTGSTLDVPCNAGYKAADADLMMAPQPVAESQPNWMYLQLNGGEQVPHGQYTCTAKAMEGNQAVNEWVATKPCLPVDCKDPTGPRSTKEMTELGLDFKVDLKVVDVRKTYTNIDSCKNGYCTGTKATLTPVVKQDAYFSMGANSVADVTIKCANGRWNVIDTTKTEVATTGIQKTFGLPTVNCATSEDAHFHDNCYHELSMDEWLKPNLHSSQCCVSPGSANFDLVPSCGKQVEGAAATCKGKQCEYCVAAEDAGKSRVALFSGQTMDAVCPTGQKGVLTCKSQTINGGRAAKCEAIAAADEPKPAEPAPPADPNPPTPPSISMPANGCCKPEKCGEQAEAKKTSMRTACEKKATGDTKCQVDSSTPQLNKCSTTCAASSGRRLQNTLADIVEMILMIEVKAQLPTPTGSTEEKAKTAAANAALNVAFMESMTGKNGGQSLLEAYAEELTKTIQKAIEAAGDDSSAAADAFGAAAVAAAKPAAAADDAGKTDAEKQAAVQAAVKEAAKKLLSDIVKSNPAAAVAAENSLKASQDFKTAMDEAVKAIVAAAAAPPAADGKPAAPAADPFADAKKAAVVEGATGVELVMESDASDGLSGGQIAGIVIGVIIALGLIGLAAMQAKKGQ